MKKTITPAVTVIFYIIGIIFLAVAAFMLVSAITYTKTYLDTYDASFADMWSNSVQYIIGQFVPYLGVGIVCLGIGKVIKETRNITVETEAAAPDEEARERQLAAADKITASIRDLAAQVEANREVLSIKIEEKEKREVVRMRELEGDIIYTIKNGEAKMPEMPVEVPAVAEESVEAVAAEECAKELVIPQIFTQARGMVMPACPVQKKYPQIFTQARGMVMPACPAQKKYPQIFTQARGMVMPACKSN